MLLYKDNLEMHIISIGGLFVTKKPMVLQTVLGSCVSVTLFDTKLKFGGMNHIVLPGAFIGDDAHKMLDEKDSRYGIFSIEKLLFDMSTLGSKKENLEAKIYGASFMGRRSQMIDVQSQNVDFVKTFLKMAKINIVEEVILQEEALKIFFYTQTGVVEVIRLKHGL